VSRRRRSRWHLEWFVDRVYASTTSNVYSLDGTKLIPVDFGTDRYPSTGRLVPSPPRVALPIHPHVSRTNREHELNEAER